MRNYAENGELCGIMRRTENCAISHSPHLNVASDSDEFDTKVIRSKGQDRHNNKSYKITSEIAHRSRVWTAEEESESWS